jgi:type IV secretory pathway VirJ component
MLLAGCGRPEHISHGIFDDVRLYRPHGRPQQFVLFLSGDDGWSRHTERVARELVAHGAMVAGIDTPELFAKLEAGNAACTFPDGDLENLSHYLQGYAQLDTYYTPMLAGYSSGATFAYAMLAQSPHGLFAGALTLGFCPDLELAKPLCPGEGVHFQRRAGGAVMDLMPSRSPLNWTTLQGSEDAVCAAAPAQQFASQVTGARFIALPEVAHRFNADGAWRQPLLSAYDQLAAANPVALPPPSADLSDLPLVEVPAAAAGHADVFAVLLSGDGGWAGLDKEVAAILAGRGVPVVGLDSLRYFWKARTPEQLSADLARVVEHYSRHWRRPRVLLIGYSQGADVLPFAMNRMPAATRQRIAQTVLMGLGERAAWEFHLGNWVGSGSDGTPILPEASKLDAATTLCLYGAGDGDSSCPRLPAGSVTARELPGGHHFGGNYESLADLILARLR